MKQNMTTLLAIAFVVAIIATGLFYGLVMMKMDQGGAAHQPMMVVAAEDLEAGAVLDVGDLRLAPRESGAALVDGFSYPEEVAGLTLLAGVEAGHPIVREQLISPNSSGGAALGVQPGYRAISVHVSDSAGVVGLLRPGHRVDAQVVQGGEQRGSSTVLRTLLQNLEVLNVEAGRGGAVSTLPVVTLLARPDEADALGVADAAAKIRLLLRHPLDGEITDRDRVTLTATMDNPPEKTGPAAPVTSTQSAAPAQTEGPLESAGNRGTR